MSVKTNAVLVCTLSLLLSACSGRASAPGSAEDAKISAEVDKILRDYQTGSDTSPQANASRYLARIQAAIFANIDQPASWQGQKCSVRFMLQRDGTVQDPTVESGDRPFCAQVMAVVASLVGAATLFCLAMICLAVPQSNSSPACAC